MRLDHSLQVVSWSLSLPSTAPHPRPLRLARTRCRTPTTHIRGSAILTADRTRPRIAANNARGTAFASWNATDHSARGGRPVLGLTSLHRALRGGNAPGVDELLITDQPTEVGLAQNRGQAVTRVPTRTRVLQHVGGRIGDLDNELCTMGKG